jgi:hypothetical protein
MSTGGDFSLQVRPVAGQRQEVLTFKFRPADTDQLRSGMPHIGIPAWIDSAARAEEEEVESFLGNGGADPSAAAANAVAPNRSRQLSQHLPSHYFGVIAGTAASTPQALSTCGTVMGTAGSEPLPEPEAPPANGNLDLGPVSARGVRAQPLASLQAQLGHSRQLELWSGLPSPLWLHNSCGRLGLL